MQRRPTRNNQINKPFVSGGVVTNFTGAAPNKNVPQVQAAGAVKADPIIATSNTNNAPSAAQQGTIVASKPEAAPNNLDMKSETQNTEIGDNASENGSLNGSFNGQKRRFMRQPIPKKIKRLRRNRRLRKILTPKNALMSLHELLGNGLSEFSILPEERGFVATVSVNNSQYEGRGPSKMAAKNAASEKALRDIIIQRMLQSPKSLPLKPSGDPTQQSVESTDDVEMVDGDNENDESEVPMLHLASFALHKLFTEWQSEGFEIPDFKIGGASSPVENMAVDKTDRVPPGTPPKRTLLPENANTMHPTTLLCMMRPATKYVDLGSEGQVPNILHRVGVEVDNQFHFIGTAKNKKLARKNAAIDACNQIFGTTFEKDEI